MKHYFEWVSTALFLFALGQLNQAQVSNIKSNVRQDMSQSTYRASYQMTSAKSTSGYETESFGESLIADIATGIMYGVALVTVEAQNAVLSERKNYPNTVSLEGTIDYATNFSTLNFTSSIRGNWGILGSDMRYSVLHDYTGSLESFDWQVLILRVPIKNIKLNYGIGFTSLFSPQTTYFESSTGFEAYLKQRKLALRGDYRWTANKGDERYRQELKLTADYRLFSKGKFHIAPLVGFTYQNYFHDDEFYLFNVGLKISLSNN